VERILRQEAQGIDGNQRCEENEGGDSEQQTAKAEFGWMAHPFKGRNGQQRLAAE
jgi:hypothetical protein